MEINTFAPVEAGMHALPPLPYAYNALEPVIDAETIMIHHDKLHKGIVDALNKTEMALVKARAQSNFDYIKALENDLAFYGSGHILHSVYWTNMTHPGKDESPGHYTLNYINWYFGSFDAFKEQFLAATKNVEGSGWGILGYNPAFMRLEILQCEKFQNLTQWGTIPILVCDVWEHAYFLKYHEANAQYVDAWWRLINWSDVERRLIDAAPARVSIV